MTSTSGKLFTFCAAACLLAACGKAPESTSAQPQAAAPAEQQAAADDLSRYQPKPYIQLQQPEWAKNATIYQINTRQFTEEGTFKAAEAHLPRLKEMGIDILWLMPIHPIGKENRKGKLGSPYSVQDYFKVNPEFGSEEDLKHFVAEAHKQGFKVILDWVANHTAWDNPMRTEHPEWYVKDHKGDFMPTPWFDWSDIIDLDFSQPGLRKYMTDALKYWVREVGVDGYRADVAGFVPVDFWENARAELDEIKPVFMLAEWESRDLHAKAFNMSYAWSWYEFLHNIMLDRADTNALRTYYSWNESAYPREALRMTFISNHDKNSWDGTQFEVFGDALEAAITLSVVGEGMPLIYNGQEAGNEKRLEFFDRDPIQWREHPIGDLYKKLFALKKDNEALWNAHWGATMIQVPNNELSDVLSFVREKGDDKVFAAFNFSPEPKAVTFDDSLYTGSYTDFTTGESVELAENLTLEMPAWGYKVYIK